MQFRVEAVIPRSSKPYVLARQLGAGGFSLGPQPQLGGIPIKRLVSQPRTLKPDGSPDLTVFAFHLVSAEDSNKLSAGQLVELSP